ncbi:MAG: hypothetical protein KIS66_05340 [Fimbriimonadaceae bacterium]|nr:hypothetical protein [Fimbriimonadaceae bacterium]
MTLRRLAVLACLALSVTGFAAPEMLIVQVLQETKDGTNPNVPMYGEIAQELDNDGRVNTIVWSVTDPIFRTATEEGKIKPGAQATLDGGRDVVRRLKIAYLLVFSAIRDGDFVTAKASLYRGASARPIWTDEKTMSVTVGGAPDTSSLASTIGRTWTRLMAQGPLKDLAPRPAVVESPPATGAQPPVTPPAETPRESDFTARFAEAERLIETGDAYGAVLRLRDLVDENPLHAECRIQLVRALLRAEEPAMAADEARRAAALLPDRPALRVLAVEALVQDGRLEEARREVTEAIGRSPTDPAAHLLSGYLSLLAQDLAPAHQAFGQSQALKPSWAAALGLACATAFDADPKAAAGHLARLGELGYDGEDPAKAVWERRLRPVLAEGIKRFADDARSFLQRARARREAEATAEEHRRLSGVGEGLQALVERAWFPEGQKAGRDAVLLGLKLGRLYLVDMGKYLETGDGQVLTDASITLNDALRNLKDAYAPKAPPGKAASSALPIS